jgi:hypothetical protein
MQYKVKISLVIFFLNSLELKILYIIYIYKKFMLVLLKFFFTLYS